ncbi:hypothetical protein VP01_4158g1 [Puccinia sorghi]|uniref:Uncharacterized protein n=1 Tax=Puccinia sorghi TaxID=27349 RepID=A0A0L6UQY9_9BASI|nr:hypothetical protein VP01_4158g1 [Puccinia sorghi]
MFLLVYIMNFIQIFQDFLHLLFLEDLDPPGTSSQYRNLDYDDLGRFHQAQKKKTGVLGISAPVALEGMYFPFFAFICLISTWFLTIICGIYFHLDEAQEKINRIKISLEKMNPSKQEVNLDSIDCLLEGSTSPLLPRRRSTSKLNLENLQSLNKSSQKFSQTQKVSRVEPLGSALNQMLLKSTRYSNKHLIIHFDARHSTNESTTFELQSLLSQNQLSNSFPFMASMVITHLALPSIPTSSNPSLPLNQILGYLEGSINYLTGLFRSTLHPRLYFHLSFLLCFDPLLNLSLILKLVHSFAYISSSNFFILFAFSSLSYLQATFETISYTSLSHLFFELESVIFNIDLSYLALIFQPFLAHFVQPNPPLVRWVGCMTESQSSPLNPENSSPS